MKIDISAWKWYPIEALFTVEKGSRLTNADMREGNVNFIGASAVNNGITKKISNDECLHPANVLTVNYNGSVAETFYQTESFWASDDVNVLYPKFPLTQSIALFLAPLIKRVGKTKYQFIDKWKQEDMKKDMIPLPSTVSGEPDWSFMERFMQVIECKAERNICALLNTVGEQRKLNTKEWKSFNVTELFDLSLPKGDIQVKGLEDGMIPLITPSNTNNGVIQFIAFTDKSTLYSAGSITVDMFGNAYYQDKDFYVTAHGHVNVLLPKLPLSSYAGLFICASIKSMFMQKYGFKDMCTQQVLKAEKIQLPQTLDGKPDWSYMDHYMKEMEQKAQANYYSFSQGKMIV